jgi:glycerol-3-phosphate acyltransferase PlsX
MNGGAFLGLGGLVIKSHGGTDAEGFAAAIEMGHDMVANDIIEKIESDLRYFGGIRSKETGTSQE